MSINELGEFLKEYGFELRRPKLPDPVLTAETTFGDKHYRFYGEGRLYSEDAKKFASEQSYNGQTGRILTLRCKSEEEKINAWIQEAYPQGPVEAWIGCYDGEEEGNWKWLINGISEMFASAYANWREGEPNNAGGRENCATMVINQGWNDVNCDNPAHVIVEFGPSKSTECDHVISDAHGQQQVDL